MIPATPPTVLILDDEPDILDSLGTLLRTRIDAVHVLSAATASEAFWLTQTHRVDLLLVDYRLRGRQHQDGLAFLHRVRRTHPDTPAILITAHPDANVFARAVNWQLVQGIFIKPFRIDAFIASILELLKKRTSSHGPFRVGPGPKPDWSARHPARQTHPLIPARKKEP